MAAEKPYIFAIDDDPQVIRAVTRDLKKQYRNHYRVASTDKTDEGLSFLKELKAKGAVVALLLSDQRMPDMQGVDFLEKAKALFPEAKRALLTAYSDTDAAIKAINSVQLDYYLSKPWDPPEEKMYPVIDDLLAEWEAFHEKRSGTKLIGRNYSKASHIIKDFLSSNLLPYSWMNYDELEDARKIVELNGMKEADLPIVLFENGTILAKPSLLEVAEQMGLSPKASSDLYDVVVIGAGPAGLAASVYGSSEGLKTLLIEKKAPGGQAGTSSRIENYLGFPKGLSGSDLARRAITQSTRFGTEFLSPMSVVEIQDNENYKKLKLEDGSEINTKAVVVTTGVNYRILEKPGLEKLTGAGVYYGAATTEAATCKNQAVFVVGGGNSAGQGAVYLSQFAKKVHILIRAKDLTSSMSSYLIDQIDQIDNIEVNGERQIMEAVGEEKLEKLIIENMETGECYEEIAGALFIFIGAKPYTNWLMPEIIKNDKGFIETGKDLLRYDQFQKIWRKKRQPYMLETSVPGIFAAGDVRAGAMNRVASAVGEGSMAIKFTHEYLAEN